jgi:DNA helicase HerA-like ATPase
MTSKNNYAKHILDGYSFEGESLTLGAATLEQDTIAKAFVKIPLKTINRHGLIPGATGTGKTKTLQVLSEQLSDKGVPVLLMDILNQNEIKMLHGSSKLAPLYSADIDRESAYEILNKKIKTAQEVSKREVNPSKRSPSSYKRQHPIVKVLTSATFIRAVFGILKKVV